jgi:hypothetical protein
MVMFAESKAQQIAENGLLSTEEKIAQLRELLARPDTSGSNPRWLMRSVCKNARRCQLFVFGALRKAFRRFDWPDFQKGEIAPYNGWANPHPRSKEAIDLR